MKRISILLSLVLSFTMMWAGNKDEADYQTYSKAIREWVWGMDLPQFKNYKVPAEYSKKSSVVLARYTEITTSTTASFNSNGILLLFGGFNIDRGVNLSKLMRQTVYINDKAALDAYSSYDFHSQSLNKSWRRSINTKRVLGAKIIKKNGEVKEVEIDEASTLSVSDDKVTRVAIPGLSVGDVLDLFAYEYSEYTNAGIDPLYVEFGTEEPVLNTQVHCVFDKDLNVRYRHFNGAPHFKRSTDSKGNYVFDLQTNISGKKLPKRYFVAAEQIPYIEIDLTRLKSNRGMTGVKVPKYALKEGVFEDPAPQEVVSETLDEINTFYWATPHNLGLSPKPRGVISDLIKKEMSGREKADIIYNVLAMCYGPNTIGYGKSNEYHMMTSMIFWLRDYDIKYQVGVTTSRYDESVEQLLNMSEVVFVIHVEDGDGYYVAPRNGVLQNGSYLPSEYCGRKAYFAPYDSRNGVVDADKYQLVTLPEAKAEDGASKIEMKVVIDGRSAEIVRKSSLLGYAKVGEQMNMLSHFQLDSAYRSVTKTKQTYDKRYEPYTYLRQQIEKSKVYIPKLQEEVLSDLHSLNIKKLGYVKIGNVGISRENPAFEYEAKYSVDNVVVNAGHDKVLKVGRLIHNQEPIEPEEEERDHDIYISSPMQTSYDIEIEIPNGYEVSASGLKALDINVSNNLCMFRSEAKAEGRSLKIHVEKAFYKVYAPASDWSKIKEVIRAHQDFRSSLLVLRKK